MSDQERAKKFRRLEIAIAQIPVKIQGKYDPDEPSLIIEEPELKKQWINSYLAAAIAIPISGLLGIGINIWFCAAVVAVGIWSDRRRHRLARENRIDIRFRPGEMVAKSSKGKVFRADLEHLYFTTKADTRVAEQYAYGRSVSL